MKKIFFNYSSFGSFIKAVRKVGLMYLQKAR